MGIRCSLKIFQKHIFEDFDDILYIHSFFLARKISLEAKYQLGKFGNGTLGN